MCRSQAAASVPSKPGAAINALYYAVAKGTQEKQPRVTLHWPAGCLRLVRVASVFGKTYLAEVDNEYIFAVEIRAVHA